MRGLRAAGLKKGDQVTTVLPNSFEQVAICLAAFQGGFYITTVNWHLVGPEISYIVNDSETKALIVADRFAADARAKTVDRDDIPSDWMGLDIGPETIERFTGVVHGSHSVFWNGPMGVFEWDAFRAGTAGIADAVASCDGYTVVGGGDSVAAIRLLGRENDVSHVSSGGGAGPGPDVAGGW